VALSFVVLLTILIHIAYAGSRVTLPLLALSLGASPATVGVMMSLLAALPMLFSVRAGREVDRIGARKPMLAGAAAMVLALLLACAVPRIEVLFVVSTLAGSGFYLFHIAVNHAAVQELLPLPPATFHILMAVSREPRHGYAYGARAHHELPAAQPGHLRNDLGDLEHDLVGERDAEGLGRPHVEDEIVDHRLLDGEVGRLRPL